MVGGAKVIGYVRVSTEEQSSSGAGLDAQRHAIEAECARRGWLLLRTEEDVSSGKTTSGRPGLKRAREACRDGEASGIVAAKLDRLTRSLLDFAQLVQEAERRGYNLVVVDQAFDLGTSHGRAMAGMLAVFAQFERDLISERTKAGLAMKRAQGVRLGRPRVLSESTRSRIRASRSRGMSLPAIAADLNSEGVATAHGGKRWYPSTVRAVLSSHP